MALPIDPRDFPSLSEIQFNYGIQSVLPDFATLSFKDQALKLDISTGTLSQWRNNPDIKKLQSIARRELYRTMINDAVRATLEIVNDKGHRDRLKAAELIFNLTGEMLPENANNVGAAIQINIVNTSDDSR